MADSRLPEKRRALYKVRRELQISREAEMDYPVRKRFPMLADEKLKVEVGLSLFTISKFSRLRKDRISSFFSEEMPLHKA